MGKFKDKFGKKRKDEKETRSNSEAMPISEAARVLENMGVSIYIEKEKGQINKFAGGNRPTKTAIEAFNKGVDLLKSGDINRAAEMFNQALAESPGYTDARYDLARIHFVSGRYDEAANEYELLLKDQPNDVDALNNLGTIYAMNNDLEEAKLLFERALRANPSFALTYRNLAAYYDAVGDENKKKENVKRALELDKNIFSDNDAHPNDR